jgi:hypothetical protein
MVELPKLPPTLDPKLVTWTPGNRPRSAFCCLCGVPIGDNEAALLVVRRDGSCARFCAVCGERHWSLRPATMQPGVGEAIVRWNHPGHCPDCGADDLELGPRAGVAVNCHCKNCGQWWNTVWRQSVGLGLIERIG